MEELFNSESNQLMLARNLYNINKANGGRANLQKFIELIPKVQIEFCKENDLNKFDMSESSVTGQKDWALLLRSINNLFIKKCYNLLKWNHFVPTRESTMVGAIGNRRMKKMSELLADDIPTVDVWNDVDVDRNNNQYWLGNRIPIWRESIHRRHYDLHNEGLRENNPGRASLETPIYGYDMSTVNSTINHWDAKKWFGMSS